MTAVRLKPAIFLPRIIPAESKSTAVLISKMQIFLFYL